MIKRFFKLFIFVLFININFCSSSFAVPANPNPVEVTQPDGTRIKIRVKGDEFYNWVEDERGYTVIKDTQTKYWTYAQKNIYGRVVPSNNYVGSKNPLHTTSLNSFQSSPAKNLIDDERYNAGKKRREEFERQTQEIYKARQKESQNNVLKAKSNIEKAGAMETKTALVILVQFKNLKFNQKAPFTGQTDGQIIQAYNDLFNKENYRDDGAVGSVKDFFKEVSYGNFEYKAVIAPIIVTMDNDYQYYGDSQDPGSWTIRDELVPQALQALHDAGFNYQNIWPGKSKPEIFSIIQAGGDAAAGSSDFIWSHKWSISPVTYDGIRFTTYNIMAGFRGDGSTGIIRVGVIAHETTHTLGMPDLYDTKYDSEGIGNFCLMAGGSWGGGDGKSPAHPCAWIKYKLGWINVKTASRGINYVKEAESEDNVNDAVYKLAGKNFSSSKEYFLIENRQPKSFDVGLPGASTGKTGLLIYHIDDRIYDGDIYQDHYQSVKTGEHYMVAIEEADNISSDWKKAHMPKNSGRGKETDYYRGGTNVTLTVFNDTDTNKPNAKSYTGETSGIIISQISASGSTMSFYLNTEPTIYEKFIDNLNDKGISFINYVMNYSPGKTKNELKGLNLTEQNKIKNYFNFESDTNMASKVNNMGEVYDSYKNNNKVYSILKSSTGVVLSSQAITIMNLNYILNKSSKTITVGNISSGDKSPLSNNITTNAIISSHTLVSGNMRFTGNECITKMTGYKTNYGFLMYKFSKMSRNNSYGIMEVKTNTDISAYTSYVYIPGDTALPYEKFIDNLNDKGISFINYVMNYSPAKTNNQLKELNLTEQNKIKNYFNFESDTNMASKVNNMGEVYDSYKNNNKVYSILKSSTGVVLSSQAITIMNLNYILNKSGKNIIVGNISSEDDSPLSNNITTNAIISSHTLVTGNMRFTGNDCITIMTGYKTNYGFLMYKFSKMSRNNSYGIMEVKTNTDISAYTSYVYIPGDIALPYKIFIDNLNDKGISFINFIMKYSPEKTVNQLKELGLQERNKIKNYFNFETDDSMANKINDMALIYYTYTESGIVCGVEEEYTGKVSSEQANLIIDLNKVLLQSEQTITSIGNISSGNESPVDNETAHSDTPKRFTGVTAVKNIQTYHKNYGTLIYSFDKMIEMNHPYDIMEVTMNSVPEDYPNYCWLEGEKKFAFNDLSQVIYYPNPAKDGYMFFERLPNDLDNFSVEIFTMTARLVKSFSAKDVIISNINKLKWDCKNENGEDVAPGVYLILIKNAGQQKVFKIAVIR